MILLLILLLYTDTLSLVPEMGITRPASFRPEERLVVSISACQIFVSTLPERGT
jgi:hypothetical protein